MTTTTQEEMKKKVKTIKKRKEPVEIEETVEKKASPEETRAFEIRDRINTFFSNVSDAYVGCGQLVDVIKKTMLSGRHLLISGGHGIAKSRIVRNCFELVRDARCFQTTMTKDQISEEILGPLIVDKLKEGIFERNVTGYMPDAHFAFTDELFRASTALFPSMFEVLNERTLTIGNSVHRCNLHTCIAATNFSVADEELAAFLDRFHVQFHLRGISGVKNISRLLTMFNEDSIGFKPEEKDQITLEEFNHVRRFIDGRPLPSRTLEAIIMSIDKFQRDNAEFAVSPRRMTDAVAYAKACVFVSDSQDKLDCLEDLFAVMIPEERQKQDAVIKSGSLSAENKGTVFDWHDIVANVVSSYAKPRQAGTDPLTLRIVSNELTDTVASLTSVFEDTMKSTSVHAATRHADKLHAIVDLIQHAFNELDQSEHDSCLSGAPSEMTCREYVRYAEAILEEAKLHVTKL